MLRGSYKSRESDCSFRSANGKELYSLFTLYCAWHRRLPQRHANDRNHQSPSFTSTGASLDLQANHPGIASRTTEIKEMMERWKMY